MSDGFAFFAEFLGLMRQNIADLDAHVGRYESFPESDSLDFVFLVNVFEHLPDWRDFLAFLTRRLAFGGRCPILCPNCAFPHESDFGLPILPNKRITGAIFRDHILPFERENDNDGLCRSLDFVRLSDVCRSAADIGLNLYLDTSIFGDLITRLEADPAFRKRQGALVLPARVLLHSGLPDSHPKNKLLQNHIPDLEFLLSRNA